MKTRGMLLRQMIRTALIGILTITFGVTVGMSVGLAAPIKGDCSGDGAIRAVDALLALQYAAGLIPHTPTNDAHYLACADVQPLDANLIPVGDGVVKAADALVILQRAAGLLTFTVNLPSAIVKISTSGPLPAGTKIGGVQATVTYPTAKALTIFDTDVVAAVGNGTPGTCGPANQTCFMLVANTTTTFGQVVVAMINPTGVANVGEIATLNFHTAAGTPSPLATDFAIAPGYQVFDSNGNTISGVSVVISAAAIQ